MDIFLKHTSNYGISELRSLNRVRLYLQVYSRACLSHRTTSKLDRRFLIRSTATVVRTSVLDWPFAEPKTMDWAIWNKAVMEKFLNHGRPGMCIDNIALGNWLGTHQRWPLWPTPPASISSIWISDPAWRAAVTIEGRVINSFSLHDAMHNRVHGTALKDFICYRTGWTVTQFEMVNWRALHRVILSQPLHYRTTAMKATYGWSHTAHWQDRIYGTTSACPMCGTIETNDHLWECPALAGERASALSIFIQASIDIGTPTLLVHIMNYKLSNLFCLLVDTLGDYQVEQDTPINIKMIQAGQAQEDLGWDNFIKGRHCSLWEDIYDSYLTTTPPPKTKYRTGITWAC